MTKRSQHTEGVKEAIRGRCNIGKLELFFLPILTTTTPFFALRLFIAIFQVPFGVQHIPHYPPNRHF